MKKKNTKFRSYDLSELKLESLGNRSEFDDDLMHDMYSKIMKRKEELAAQGVDTSQASGIIKKEWQSEDWPIIDIIIKNERNILKFKAADNKARTLLYYMVAAASCVSVYWWLYEMLNS